MAKMKSRGFLFLGLLFVSGLLHAQTVTISARVIDSETKEPLPFASVGLKNRPIGTITNLHGEFDFHIPVEFRNDVLVINMLGYEPYEDPAWTVTNQPATIEMVKSTRLLDEVVVSDSLRGGEILTIALGRITQNYPMKPFLLDGFYRDVKEVAGTYISLLEAAVKIFDEDYRAPRNKFKLRERVALQEVRRSLGYENKFTAYFDEGNLLEDILLHNNIRYRQFPEEEIFFKGMTREKDSYYNGHPVFVISQKYDYHLTIFVDKNTYGIIHLEYENNEQETIRKRRGLVSKFVNLKRVIDFKSYNGVLFLNYITLDSKINWYDSKTSELKFETQLHQQLLINKVYPDTDEYIGTTEKMKNYGLQYQDLKYNKAFWDNYNVIKESPLDRKIINDLEKNISLDKQFQNKN
ncbi:MAG TPA: carboxypeptidase-like regulatory domain-containing protein [Cyclobacteriaceae bacterium]|nr:carboxypeptidase-like regulatory domain-containing protein [Cyclobacteriaceae bacterium]MCB9237533.1 carboxypeptidase-like regulatory domain-containing protein [Flammeovirgaceae bacterium]MCB0500296.1 carboxypeptidase-like regulatory domain-containing protein [Cyclobacteriaceae bacterium]MCO5270364.1 carboxypeptidase-like regulatory domain-containing protein [Cyclobacteriaceae bacterium]MCW5903535.1 carboxypeptidase-like regulatory domain-containing protein [Cyclobacteriaceae bacterium]